MTSGRAGFLPTGYSLSVLEVLPFVHFCGLTPWSLRSAAEQLRGWGRGLALPQHHNSIIPQHHNTTTHDRAGFFTGGLFAVRA